MAFQDHMYPLIFCASHVRLVLQVATQRVGGSIDMPAVRARLKGFELSSSASKLMQTMEDRAAADVAAGDGALQGLPPDMMSRLIAGGPLPAPFAALARRMLSDPPQPAETAPAASAPAARRADTSDNAAHNSAALPPDTATLEPVAPRLDGADATINSRLCSVEAMLGQQADATARVEQKLDRLLSLMGSIALQLSSDGASF